MDIFYREYGSGFPLVVLHGLYGSSDNWVSIAGALSDSYRVILVDQRNHGASPHCSTHSYRDMAEDLHRLVLHLNLREFHLMGHSMGGRVAMLFHTLYPVYVRSLVVVDVAPWRYNRADSLFAATYAEHVAIVEALLALPLESIASRQDADDYLSALIGSVRLRQFLLKNLRRKQGDGFCWGLNLTVLQQNLDSILCGVDIDPIIAAGARVLFVRGANSNYIVDGRVDELLRVYPNAQVVSINNAGHWVHAEQPIRFVATVRSFLSGI
ncbi:MAG: alpha/beta fold hydrolase [Bacteroidales bacterium]|nr:alpha/beta fold hydrolase [Bacteroidales bacterium]